MISVDMNPIKYLSALGLFCAVVCCNSIASGQQQQEDLAKQKVAPKEIARVELKVPELKVPGIKELSALGRPLSKFLPESVSASLKLRDSFLAKVDSQTQASVVQTLSQVFAAKYGELLDGDFEAPAIFEFSDIDFESAIRGIESCPNATEIFGPFAGKWYGRWAQFDVDHHWSRVIKPDEHTLASKFPDYQIGWQYAWIGDGYGMNHCLSFEDDGTTKRFILGYTEHLADGDFKNIVARRPHVGINAGSGKLIWITAREVFFEEAHANKDGELDSYSIIGFNYIEETDDSKTRLVFRDGFVAVYSRSENARIPFRNFDLTGSVERKVIKPKVGTIDK